MAQKRRTSDGRVTPSKKALARAGAAGNDRSTSPRTTRTGPRATERETVAPSSRYTAPKANYRMRPRWHRVAGWLGVAAGLALAVLNDAMLFMEDGELLPFGHQEFYLLLALVVAGASTWFLGLFDRGTTIYD